jgi:hypothetical protein
MSHSGFLFLASGFHIRMIVLSHGRRMKMRVRIKWMFWLILAVGLSRGTPAVVQETDASSELLKTADEMVQTTARLRGLEPKAPISKGVKTKAEISGYLNEMVQREYSEGELQEKGKLLRKLGLIPASIDYKDFTLKLLTEQIEGYYDPDKKTFFIASWIPAEEQKPVMVHELTHALQDEYFNVNEILKQDRKRNNDDVTLAHQALLEGDGMVVMLNYLLEPAHRNFAQLPDLAVIMRAQMLTMQSQIPIFKSAPSYIQETLLFPYGYGASFLQQAWKKNPSWQSVNKIYSDLPASTEQIMHPEKYFAGRDDPKPVKSADPVSRLGNGWKIAYKNVLGEFSLGLLLSVQLTEGHARRSVTGWGGDEVMLLEDSQGKDAAFVNTVWDTADDADKFFAAMQDWFQKGHPQAPKTDESPEGFSITHDGEFDSIRREGTGIHFIIGLPESESAKVKGF